jgi:hypothetical protein
MKFGRSDFLTYKTISSACQPRCGTSIALDQGKQSARLLPPLQYTNTLYRGSKLHQKTFNCTGYGGFIGSNRFTGPGTSLSGAKTIWIGEIRQNRRKHG